MLRLDVHRRLDDARRTAALHLVAAEQQRTGRRLLSDQLWAQLAPGADTTAVIGEIDHRLVGVALLDRGLDSWSLEVVAEPDHRHLVTPALIGAALDHVAAVGGGVVRWWTFAPDASAIALATEAGFTAERALHQMYVSLPVTERTDVVTRSFEVGRDDEAWLGVNNAAFAWHAEQGGWTTDTLHRRQHEPWFDADGFLVHERDGRMAAFCWTKLHRDVEPQLGEIYVIAVHPDFHGLGLGRALTLAGLQHIESSGIHTGMLYVDHDNIAAVRLYEHLGFHIVRTDRAFVRTVPKGST